MNGYGSHTFKMVNAKDEAVYVKFHYKSDQGIKTFNRQEVFKLLTNKCMGLEWQYELLSFQGRDTKSSGFLAIRENTQRKSLYFVKRHRAELSKIGHHFRKQSGSKIELIKKVTTNLATHEPKFLNKPLKSIYDHNLIMHS